jgi:hypothetical protein
MRDVAEAKAAIRSSVVFKGLEDRPEPIPQLCVSINNPPVGAASVDKRALVPIRRHNDPHRCSFVTVALPTHR